MGEKKEKSRIYQTYVAVQTGLLRSSMSVAEYPLECIKTRWQKYPDKSLKWVVKETYTKLGFRGFYSGFIPASLKKVPMQVYRWPLLLQLPQYYENKRIQELPQKEDVDNKGNYVRKIKANTYAAITIATLETAIGGPIETCRLELTVNRDKTSTIKQYFKHFNSIKRHYIGLPALFSKGVLGWSSFLLGANVSRAYWREKNQGKPMTLAQTSVTALATGFANATLILPADFIRTQRQANCHDSSAQFSKKLITLYQSAGIKSFYCGWPIRFAQLTLSTFLSLPVIEHYEQKYSSPGL